MPLNALQLLTSVWQATVPRRRLAACLYQKNGLEGALANAQAIALMVPFACGWELRPAWHGSGSAALRAACRGDPLLLHEEKG